MTIQEEIQAYKQVFVVCDRNVGAFAHMLGDYPLLTIAASEETKTMDTVVNICRWLLEKGADRGALVLAVGGGVTTDMVGFAASIYKRGIAYANFPTTLLGMVDAGLGGKTGVNLDSYKNILGVIRQPEFTFMFADVLRSLPRKEFMSGAAEMLKSFIISNKSDDYERAVKLLRHYAITGESPANTTEGLNELSALITDASQVKRDIVDKDPYENGERRKLNLGHTWAHAIEWWQRTIPLEAAPSVCPQEDPAVQSPPTCTHVESAAPVHPVCPHGEYSAKTHPVYTHGEAVAIGIVQAALKAEEMGIADEGLAGKIKSDFASCGLPTELPCPIGELEAAMHKDKKTEGDKIRFVLPVRIGKVVVKLL